MTFLQVELPLIPSGVWKEVHMWLKSFPCTKKSALVAFFARKIGPFCLHAKSESNSPVIQCITMHIAFLCEHLQSFQQSAVSFVVEFSVITKESVGGGRSDWDGLGPIWIPILSCAMSPRNMRIQQIATDLNLFLAYKHLCQMQTCAQSWVKIAF